MQQDLAHQPSEAAAPTLKTRGHLNAESYEKLLNNFTKAENNQENIEELNNVLETFYGSQMKQREDVLQDIKKAVNHMMNSSKKESGCQTEEDLLEMYV